MPFVSAHGTRLFYTETGPSMGRPLLLLHAALQTGESVAPLQDLLKPDGFRMLSPDQRGHGRTANPARTLSIPRLADDMVVLMAELGLERPLVIGYSLGGIVGLELARRGLVSALVVMASRFRSAQRAPLAFNPEGIRARSPVWAEQLAAKHVEVAWEELAEELGSMLASWPGLSEGELAEIDCPLLIVQGDRDTMVPIEQARALKAAVRGARLVEIPRAQHPELLYRPDALRAVASFVRALP